MPTGGSIFTASVSFGLILMAILASVLPFWTFNLGDGMIKMSMTPWRACLTVTFAGDSSEKCEDTATYFHDMHQLMAVLNGGSMSTEEVARRLHTGDWEGSSSSGTNAGSNSNANTWTPVPDDVNACGDTSVHEVLIKVARIGFIVVCLLLVSHGVAALMAHRASIMILGGIMFFFGSAPSCFLIITYWIPFCGSLSKSLSDFTGSSAGSGIYPALILGVLIWINGIVGCCCAQRPVAMQPTSVVYMPLAPGSVQQQQTVVYVQAGQPYQPQQAYPQAQYQQPEPVQGSIYQEDLYKDNANV